MLLPIPNIFCSFSFFLCLIIFPVYSYFSFIFFIFLVLLLVLFLLFLMSLRPSPPSHLAPSVPPGCWFGAGHVGNLWSWGVLESSRALLRLQGHVQAKAAREAA